ncbi:unnamed protein product [Closterium sp. Naga37s-1]|nr:unnamed protein product [Closterium sp. Naga37s-1]
MARRPVLPGVDRPSAVTIHFSTTLLRHAFPVNSPSAQMDSAVTPSAPPAPMAPPPDRISAKHAAKPAAPCGGSAHVSLDCATAPHASTPGEPAAATLADCHPPYSHIPHCHNQGSGEDQLPPLVSREAVAEASPLGLTLRKTPSLVEFISHRLSQGTGGAGGDAAGDAGDGSDDVDMTEEARTGVPSGGEGGEVGEGGELARPAHTMRGGDAQRTLRGMGGGGMNSSSSSSSSEAELGGGGMAQGSSARGNGSRARDEDVRPGSASAHQYAQGKAMPALVAFGGGATTADGAFASPDGALMAEGALAAFSAPFPALPAPPADKLKASNFPATRMTIGTWEVRVGGGNNGHPWSVKPSLNPVNGASHVLLACSFSSFHIASLASFADALTRSLPTPLPPFIPRPFSRAPLSPLIFRPSPPRRPITAEAQQPEAQQRRSKYEGDLVAKCYFAKRKLVWEVLEGGLKSKVEVQWGDIALLRASTAKGQPGVLEIEVSRPPQFFKEMNPQPRRHTLWQSTPDFTAGQANSFRRHVVEFAEGVLNKHLHKLLASDPRLRDLAHGTSAHHTHPGQHGQHGQMGQGGQGSAHMGMHARTHAHAYSRDVLQSSPHKAGVGAMGAMGTLGAGGALEGVMSYGHGKPAGPHGALPVGEEGEVAGRGKARQAAHVAPPYPMLPAGFFPPPPLPQTFFPPPPIMPPFPTHHLPPPPSTLSSPASAAAAAAAAAGSRAAAARAADPRSPLSAPFPPFPYFPPHLYPPPPYLPRGYMSHSYEGEQEDEEDDEEEEEEEDEGMEGDAEGLKVWEEGAGVRSMGERAALSWIRPFLHLPVRASVIHAMPTPFPASPFYPPPSVSFRAPAPLPQLLFFSSFTPPRPATCHLSALMHLCSTLLPPSHIPSPFPFVYPPPPAHYPHLPHHPMWPAHVGLPPAAFWPPFPPPPYPAFPPPASSASPLPHMHPHAARMHPMHAHAMPAPAMAPHHALLPPAQHPSHCHIPTPMGPTHMHTDQPMHPHTHTHMRSSSVSSGRVSVRRGMQSTSSNSNTPLPATSIDTSNNNDKSSKSKNGSKNVTGSNGFPSSFNIPISSTSNSGMGSGGLRESTSPIPSSFLEEVSSMFCDPLPFH